MTNHPETTPTTTVTGSTLTSKVPATSLNITFTTQQSYIDPHLLVPITIISETFIRWQSKYTIKGTTYLDYLSKETFVSEHPYAEYFNEHHSGDDKVDRNVVFVSHHARLLPLYEVRFPLIPGLLFYIYPLNIFVVTREDALYGEEKIYQW